MRETIEGQGKLENWDRPDKKWAVRYQFEITTDIAERPGFPRVASRRHSSGSVRSLADEPLPEGYYRLYAADGEVLKVKNLGGMWMILAS